MRIRVEVPEGRSPNFKLILRLFKRFPTYQEFEDDGISLYSVDFTENDLDSFEAIEQMILSWKAIYYWDGKLVTRAKIWDNLDKWRHQRSLILKKRMNQRRSEIPTLKEYFSDNLEN